MPRRTSIAIATFLGWTLFVWVGRVRNALTDSALEGSARIAPLVLAASFVIPAFVLAVVWSRRSRATGVLRWGVTALGAWTVVVWVVRAADIALTSDRGAAFVAVHVVLAVVSIALAWIAVAAVRALPADTPAEHKLHQNAS